MYILITLVVFGLLVCPAIFGKLIEPLIHWLAWLKFEGDVTWSLGIVILHLIFLVLVYYVANSATEFYVLRRAWALIRLIGLLSAMLLVLTFILGLNRLVVKKRKPAETTLLEPSLLATRVTHPAANQTTEEWLYSLCEGTFGLGLAFLGFLLLINFTCVAIVLLVDLKDYLLSKYYQHVFANRKISDIL